MDADHHLCRDPQIIPPFLSFTIYRWDINVRMSTIIGAVGGGGIGFLLFQWIRLTDWSNAGIAVWMIAITVMIMDYASARAARAAHLANGVPATPLCFRCRAGCANPTSSYELSPTGCRHRHVERA